MTLELSDVLMDPGEKVLMSLGEGYFTSYLTTGNLKHTFWVLTDKRIYFFGRCFYKSNRNYGLKKVQYVLDLKDITGTGFTTARFSLSIVLELLLFLVICLAMGLFLYFNRFFEAFRYADDKILQVCVILLVLCLIAAPVFFCSRKVKIFAIEYSGGKFAFPALEYLDKEMLRLEKLLHRAKDASMGMGEMPEKDDFFYRRINSGMDSSAKSEISA